jgi:hypothetical protein
LGLILPYHKRDLDSDLNEQAKSQSNSGKIRVKSLLASILTVSRLVMIHDRGPVIHPWRSNAHGELQWRFSALLDYGLNGPTNPHRFVEHVVRLTLDPTAVADVLTTSCSASVSPDVFEMFLTMSTLLGGWLHERGPAESNIRRNDKIFETN